MSYLQRREHIYQQECLPEIIVVSQTLKVHVGKSTTPIGQMIEEYKNLPPQIFIYPGVSQQSFGFVFGPPKSGKTTFIESLFLYIAGGLTSFLGNELSFTNKKCLFISLEEGAKRQRIDRNSKQLEGFGIEQRTLIEANYIVSNKHMPTFIYNDAQWDIIKKEIADSGALVVAIDSLNRLSGDSNADEEVAKKVTKKLQELVTQLNITLFVLNHTTKSSWNEIQTHSSMRGSGLYAAEADFLITVNRTGNNNRYIKLVSSRYGNDDEEMVTEFEISNNKLVKFKALVTEASLFMDQDGRIDETNERIVTEEMQAIVKAKNLNEVQTNELKHLYDDVDHKMVRKTFFNAIDKLEQRGRIIKLRRGVYSLK